jgi:hypothetical protein
MDFGPDGFEISIQSHLCRKGIPIKKHIYRVNEKEFGVSCLLEADEEAVH